jgi:hypothetical protein
MIEVLKRIAEKLRLSGANLPAPQRTGTIDDCIVIGLCIALQLVESEIEALEQPPQRTWVGSGDLEDSNAYLTSSTWVKLTNEEKNND